MKDKLLIIRLLLNLHLIIEFVFALSRMSIINALLTAKGMVHA
jgi:hypothetical protein